MQGAAPSASGGGDGGGDHSFWSSLLKWSLAQQENGNVAGVRDGGLGTISEGEAAAPPAPPAAREVSEADREWFYEAMKARMEDTAATMGSIAAALAEGPRAELDAGTVEVRVALLEELAEKVERLDAANDLDAVGGLAPVLQALASPHAEIQSAAAEVVANVVQNNPKSQDRAMDLGAMGKLLAMLDDGASDGAIRKRPERVLAMALYAVGALVRGQLKAMDAFVLGNGPAACVGAMRGCGPRVQRRALNFLAYVVTHHRKGGEASAAAGGIRAGVACLMSRDDAVRHAALSYLLGLARVIDFEANPGAVSDYRAPAVGLALGRISGQAGSISTDEADARREELSMAAELKRMLDG